MGREGYHIGIVARVMYKCTCVAVYIVVSNFFSDVKAKISHPSKWNMLNRTQKCMSSFFFPAYT